MAVFAPNAKRLIAENLVKLPDTPFCIEGVMLFVRYDQIEVSSDGLHITHRFLYRGKEVFNITNPTGCETAGPPLPPFTLIVGECRVPLDYVD